MGGNAVPVRFEGAAPRFMKRPERFAVYLADASLAAVVDESVLSDSEAKRAAGFARGEHRDRYVVAHVMLRVLLAAYMGWDPMRLPLYREACPMCGRLHGRPAVASAPRLHFSLAHCSSFALAAFAVEPVGVDVSPLPGEAVFQDFLRCLDEVERDEFAARPQEERRAGLARAWVRKEARLKAIGTGLAVDPAALYEGVGPESGPGVVDLEVPQGHAAALAFQWR